MDHTVKAPLLTRILTLGLVACVALSSCGGRSGDKVRVELGQGEDEVKKGPHGGRLLGDKTFSLEVTIYEREVPPEFRVYAYQDGKPLDPGRVEVRIALHRFGGVVQNIGFTKDEDYQRGSEEIYEPHSFDVVVSATFDGRGHEWKYASYEGRTELSETAVKNAGIEVESAGPATVTSRMRLNGRVVPNEDHLLHVRPRYPGVAREARKRLGDLVAKDEVVAVVESNESLQRYEVRSAIAGTVIEKDVTAGEFVNPDASLYTVLDLSSVWVDLSVFRRDYASLKVGAPVVVTSVEGGTSAKGTLTYLSPVGAPASQSLLARVEIPNPENHWQPGVFVTGEVTTAEEQVPVAVRSDAIQTFRDWDVVFMNDGKVFEIAILEVGRRDAEWTEVVSGIAAGQRYVSKNSFVVKADIGKSGASHDH